MTSPNDTPSPRSSLKTPRNNEGSLEGESNQVKRVQWKDLVATTVDQIREKEQKLEEVRSEMKKLIMEGKDEGKHYEFLEDDETRLNNSIKDLEEREKKYYKSASQEVANTAGFKLTATVPHGFSYGNYKGNLYKSAMALQGYSMKCEYQKTGVSELAPEGQLTTASDLVVELYFETKERAVKMITKWRQHHKKFDQAEEKPVQFKLEEPENDFKFDLNHLVKEGDYDQQNIPPRRFDIATALRTESIPSHTTKVTEEQVKYESLMDHSNNKYYALKSCHIYEKKYCKGKAADTDLANRLYMDENLHTMYDDRNLLSVTSEQKEFQQNDDGRCPVTLQLYFKTTELAEQYFPSLRSPRRLSTAPSVIEVTIFHDKPRSLVKYLVERHNRNMDKMYNTGDDSVSVSSQSLTGCEEEETDEGPSSGKHSTSTPSM